MWELYMWDISLLNTNRKQVFDVRPTVPLAWLDMTLKGQMRGLA